MLWGAVIIFHEANWQTGMINDDANGLAGFTST